MGWIVVDLIPLPVAQRPRFSRLQAGKVSYYRK
jgi:hypothetical protein